MSQQFISGADISSAGGIQPTQLSIGAPIWSANGQLTINGTAVVAANGAIVSGLAGGISAAALVGTIAPTQLSAGAPTWSANGQLNINGTAVVAANGSIVSGLAGGISAAALVGTIAPTQLSSGAPSWSANGQLNINGTAVVAANGAIVSSLAVSEFASGTALVFQQTTAPTGWTKQTTHNDKALRVVSGTVGSGGTVPFSTAFANTTPSGSVSTSITAVSGTVGVSLSSGGSVNLSSGGSVSGYTLQTSDIPGHSHTTNGPSGVGSPGGAAPSWSGYGTTNYGSSSVGGGGSHSHGFSNPSYSLTNPSYSGSFSFGSGSASSSFSGTNIPLQVNYVDTIIATKN